MDVKPMPCRLTAHEAGVSLVENASNVPRRNLQGTYTGKMNTYITRKTSQNAEAIQITETVDHEAQ